MKELHFLANCTLSRLRNCFAISLNICAAALFAACGMEIIMIQMRYTYKNYPYSERATKYSKIAGILTCFAMRAVFTLIVGMAFYGIFMNFGFDDNANFPATFIFAAVFNIVLSLIKSVVDEKIEWIALEDGIDNCVKTSRVQREAKAERIRRKYDSM